MWAVARMAIQSLQFRRENSDAPRVQSQWDAGVTYFFLISAIEILSLDTIQKDRGDR